MTSKMNFVLHTKGVRQTSFIGISIANNVIYPSKHLLDSISAWQYVRIFTDKEKSAIKLQPSKMKTDSRISKSKQHLIPCGGIHRTMDTGRYLLVKWEKDGSAIFKK